MESAYPTNIKTEVYINSAWEDLSPDVVTDIDVKRGIKGNSYTDRVASTGYFNFTLRNDNSCLGGVDNYYTPRTNNSKSGWTVGLPVRLVVSYDGTDYTKFYGHIITIKPNPSIQVRRVEVSVADWMDYAATHSLKDLTVEYNKDISDAVTSIVSVMPVQPQGTTFSTGVDTFPTVFDANNKSLKALSEFNKLALSEFGYIYLKTNLYNGENLVVESRNDRSAQSVPRDISTPSVDSSYCVTEADEYLMTEAGEYIIFDETQALIISGTMTSTELSVGERLINKVSLTVHPRTIDSGSVVLYSISNPISIGASETKAIVRAKYQDPNNLAETVSGVDMITPVATTDYLFNQYSTGSGMNLTTNLSASVVFYNSDFTYILGNSGSVAGYVTQFQVRGKGVYTYEEQEYLVENSESTAIYGDRELNIDLKYQDDIYTSARFGNLILYQSSELTTDVVSIQLLANISPTMLLTFLSVDIGDLITIQDESNGVDSYYYIQGINFTIKQGGIIYFEYDVIEALALTEDFWELGEVGASELGETTILGYTL